MSEEEPRGDYLADDGAPKKGPRKGAAAEESPDFQHLVRIAETDLEGRLHTVIALAKIPGVGQRTSTIILDSINVPRRGRIGDLDDGSIEKITKALQSYTEDTPGWLHNRRNDWATGEDLHLISGEIPTYDREDKNRLRKIRCYRGIRHEQGKKVRGQRSRSNGRKGLALGVSRVKQQPGDKK